MIPPDQLAPLDVLVGEWTQEVLVPGVAPGHTVLEWTLDGRFLLQRTEIAQPEFPNSFAVISHNSGSEYGGSAPFVYHYYDSRGVVRVYDMELRDGVWTLQRTRADFTPLAFAQRFEAVLSADGDTFEGSWQQSHDGGTTWELDFPVRLTRLGFDSAVTRTPSAPPR